MSHVCDVALKLGQVNPHRLRVRCSQSRIMQGRAAHDNAAGVFRHPATFIVCGGAAKTKSSSLARSMGSEKMRLMSASRLTRATLITSSGLMSFQGAI